MSDLPASHYLGIYEHRLSMSERGITNPKPQVVAGVRRLVAALRELKPEEKVALDATSGRAIFKKSATGELLAQIDFDEAKAKPVATANGPTGPWLISNVRHEMNRLTLVSALLLVAGCASHDHHAVAPELTWAKETIAFERVDVQAQVDERFRNGDFRFEGWVKSAVDTVVILPGIAEEEGTSLRDVSLAVGEILFIEDMPPFLVGSDMANAWQKRTAALFDHMLRFNQALFAKLVREGMVKTPSNQSPQPTTGLEPGRG